MATPKSKITQCI